MFGLIKQVFNTLLSFSRSLATECVSLNNKPCLVSPTLIDLNPVDLKYYPFVISLGECSGGNNSVDDNLSTKICVLSKTKDINVKEFNIITNKNEGKTIVKHISCDCKYKFNSTICNSNKKCNNETCQCECKVYRTSKKNIMRILAHVFVKMVSIQKALLMIKYCA